MKQRARAKSFVFASPLRSLRRLALRALVLLGCLLVSLPAWSGPSELYRCRYSGKVMNTCCCPSEVMASRHVPTSPEAKAASCCETLRRAGSSASPAAPERSAEVAAPPLLSSLTPVPRSSAPVVRQLISSVSDHARDGPGLFLRDCRLLN